MLIKIHKNRSVSSSGTWGTKNENNYEILNFEFPEELEEYNKRIVYYLGNQKVWDAIIDNKAILTNAITTKGSVKAYIWCTKSDEAFETDVDFRTQLFEMNFFENENADGIVPTEEQIDGFNTMLTAMNEKIEEIDELETTIENAETQRQENEETRQENESTRQDNEQTRQEQEADRERRTDEAIGNIEDKTAEYNANAEAKTTAFNNNATQKTNQFNSNYTQKVNDFNTNASSKTSAFNSNAETKTNAFNTNATNKTNNFNNNATEKTSEFNTNAESKTSTFNDNATSKTNDFNDNATEKTDEFNTNAQEKINEYDEHIVEYQAQIDELQEEVEELSENMPWNTTEQATEISVDDAAKYSKNKLELFGNTSQDSTTGKNLFNVSDSWAYWQTLGFRLINNIIKISIGDGNGGLGQGVQGEYTNYNFDTNKLYCFSITPKSGDLIFKESASYKWLQVTIYIKYSDDTTSAKNVRITHGMNMASVLVTFTADKTPVAFAIGRYSPVDSLQTNQEAEYYVQLEEGSTATDYEPYTNGPSPNPDYPQPIHVVTGENTIEVHSKNWFDGDFIFGEWSITDASFSTKADRICCKDYIKVLPGFTYTISYINSGTTYLLEFDENKQYLNKYTRVTYRSLNGTITLGETTHYIKFYCIPVDQSKISVNEQCQLEIGLIATEYQKYYHADYPINLGSLELCKIGDYHDYLYKENGNWYKYGAIGKIVLDGHRNYVKSSRYSSEDYPVFFLQSSIQNFDNNCNIYCNKFIQGDYIVLTDKECMRNLSQLHVRISASRLNGDTPADYKTWLASNNLTVYYQLATPTITQITDETLIAQLDEIYEHFKLVKGTNNITVTADDLAPYIKLNYMQDLPSKLDNLDSRLSLLE